MKKGKTKPDPEDEMLFQYDFTNGIRGKHSKAYREGHKVAIHKQDDGTTDIQYFQLEDGAVMLDPDVREYFDSAEDVNATLRALIKIIDKI